MNVFMAGDSHVCSRVYPERVGEILEDADPEIFFDYGGKTGAGFYTYNDSPHLMQEIYDANPDVLVVHLGTNDSYTPNFHAGKFLNDVTKFYDNVMRRFPNCKIVLVTPFFNRLKNGSLNTSTRKCAQACCEFAEKHENAFVVDNNAEYGMFFLDGGDEIIRPDGVHLTVKGYTELADQVSQGLINIDALWVDCE